MISKKNVWFLTLFSLILALSVYYVTMPSEALLDVYNNIEKSKNSLEDVSIEEADILAVYRLEDEVEVSRQLDILKMQLVNTQTSIEEKNEAYDRIRDIEKNRTLEFELENKLKQELGYKSFVKINEDRIVVTIRSSKYDVSLANKVMQMVQKSFKETKYITVKFE